MLQDKPTLTQGILLFDKWILNDKELMKKFEFDKEFEKKIKFNLTMKQYKYILTLFINKKRFLLNEIIHSLGAKTRSELEEEDNANMQANGCYC